MLSSVASHAGDVDAGSFNSLRQRGGDCSDSTFVSSCPDSSGGCTCIFSDGLILRWAVRERLRQGKSQRQREPSNSRMQRLQRVVVHYRTGNFQEVEELQRIVLR